MSLKSLYLFCTMFSLLLAATPSASAATYDPTTNFVAGWTAGTNPNGVWSYGYSSGLPGTVTLYTTPDSGSALSPYALNWGGNGNAPAIYYNNGPEYNNGNTDVLANQIDLCAGWPDSNVYSDLVFTAPVSGEYNIVGSFRGDQIYIDVNVGVLGNGNPLFGSSITSLGQLAPFDTNVYLTSGETAVFYSVNAGGWENTGLDVTITQVPSAIPEPASFLLIGSALLGMAVFIRKVRG